MWRKGKKWLALVLAFTLSFGDFLPAAAEAESPAAPADGQEAVTEEPDAQTPEEVPEETVKEELPLEGAETAEIAEQAVDAGQYIEKGVLKEWNGTITVPAGENWRFTYTPSGAGDYLVEYTRTDTKYASVAPEDGQSWTSWIDFTSSTGTAYTGIGCVGHFKANESFVPLVVVFYNSSEKEQEFVLKTDRDYPSEELTVWEKKTDIPKGLVYYTFTAPYDGIYSCASTISSYWYKENTPARAIESWETPLKAGEKVRICGENFSESEESIQIWGYEATEVKGSKLKAVKDGESYYLFTPSRSGEYHFKSSVSGSASYFSTEEGIWKHWYSEDAKVYLEKGQEYWIRIYGIEGDMLCAEQRLTILDYDYYQAFTASGGSVSIGEGGSVTLTGGKAGTVLNRMKALTKNVLSVEGVDVYSSAYADDFAAANLYWKGKAGAFQAESFYKVNADGSLTEVTGEEVTDDDETLVVRYAPEVVWVESMTITTEDNTTLSAGKELQLTANPKAATEKYSFRQEPQIRWESSNPEIADVDQNGLVTTYQPGNVTITAYADEDLRDYYRRQGMKMQPYTAASISLNVIKGEEALTGLKVTPESTELVLSRESNGAGGYVDGHASSYATVEAVPSSVMLESKYMYWSIYRKDDPKDKKDCAITGDLRSATFTVWKPGDYTIEVICYKDFGDETPLATGTADIHVIAGKDPFPLAQGLGAYAFRNVDGVMTFGNYERALDEQIANGVTDYTGTFVYTDLKLNELQSTTKLSVGTNSWLVFYVPGENDNYSEAMSVVTVEYGDLDIRLSSSAGNTLSATIQGGTAATATAYENKTALITELWCNGEKIDPTMFADCGYTVGTKTFTTKKNDILSVNEAKDEVTGLKAGSDTLNVFIPVIATDTEGKVTKATFKKTLNFTVKDESARAVKTIEIWNKEDEKQTFENGSQTTISADKEAAQTIALGVSVKDFAGVDYSTAKLTWKTSDKSVASVAAAKDGSVTLTIPKGATGVAEITATANDYNKASTSFKMVVLDSDVRVVNSTITVNSKSEEYAELQIMPNTLWAEAMGIAKENLRVEVSAINADDKLEFDGQDGEIAGKLVDLETGTIGFRYTDPNEKAGTMELGLTIYSYDARKNGADSPMATTMVKIKVVNKPSIPKTTAKVTGNYNTFWKNENSYAEVLLTAGADVENIVLENNDYYEIADTEKVNGSTNQWKVILKAKTGVTPKKSPVVFDVTYTDYRETAPVKAIVNVVNQKPSLAIAAQNNVTAFYSELGERTSIVILQAAEGVTAKDIELTAAAAKNFQITRVLQEPSQDNEYYAAIEVTSLTGKTADVEFTVKSSQFAQAGASVTSKKLRLTAKKLSAEKPVIYNTTTAEVKTSYTLQQVLAGKETLKLDGWWQDCDYSRYNFRISVDGGDKFTEQMLQAGYLKLEKTKYDGYMIQATPTLFTQKGSSCKLKFTFYATAYNGDRKYHTMKSVVVSLKLQKQKQAAPISVKLTAKGSLNVVDRMSYTYLMPTFQNLPQGAWVESVEFTDIEHAMRYQMSDRMDGSIQIWVNPDLGGIPIGKDKIDLVYNIRQSDGTRVTVPTTVTINLTQTATVKADKKSVTLYNTATGERYGSTVTLELGKVTRGTVSSIDVTGLDGSGISCAKDPEAGKLCFYVDPAAQRGTAKNYSVKLTVHLNNAGVKNGKEVTYTVPVTVTLKK